MAIWHNGDSLVVTFGHEEGQVATHPAGEYLTHDGSGAQVMEILINLASLTQTETILNNAVKIPANAHVLWVETICIVAAATGTAIDVGIIAEDRSTEVDFNGFLAAFETGDMNAVGETRRFFETHTQPASITGTGALVGQEVTTGGWLSASMTDATAFTAGKVKVRIGYISKGIDVPG